VSGIVGMYERSGAPVDRALLLALTHSISYCGPDARDTWASGQVGFGHTMLRTTYESQNEQQPAGLAGQFWITADARIDCRDELVSEITRVREVVTSGALLSKVSDSELILRAYATWGEECVQHLRGDFAFAIWDVRKKMLFCARDHFGVKPFYYAEPGELFLFSNVLDCLRQHPDISGDLNDAAIGDFLLFGLNCDEATTTFRDIRRLPAAHSMTVSTEGLRIRRYWSAPTSGRIRYKRPEEFVEHFQILLQAAVADRLRADRAGILLSGGLDSSTVATTARDLSRAAGGTQDLRAYTVVYNSLIPDEEGKYALEAADFLKIPIQFIARDALRPFERWGDPALSWPEPVDDPFFAGFFDQCEAVAADRRVALSGEGSDNLMHFQMWPYVKNMIHHREWFDLATRTSRYLSVRSSPLPGLRRRVAGLIGKDSTAPIYPQWLAPDFARRLNLEDRAKQWNELPEVQPHPVLPKAHASLSIPHWATMFEQEHAGFTRSTVEVRHPFIDLRIVNFLLALPPFPFFFQKNLLREATAGRLPESVRTRRKTPLQGNPLSAHMQQSGTKWLNDVDWLPEMDSYTDRRSIQPVRNEKNAEQLYSGIRPLCLNFWLQSTRKVRYNLRAEVRNA
jgi:asparagine synthase (glutamine-hydrolysing)